jgi:2-desacetyl-2-hydroxyethyl bacteriochlorophyllide A dehydrogenase
MQAKAVVFTAPQTAEVKRIQCPEPSPDDVVVRVTESWISNGTEGSYFRGERSDGDTPFVEGDPLPFPVVAGYQKIGVVEQVGANAPAFEIGEQVFATIGRVEGMHHWYAGQVSPSVTPGDNVWHIPDGIDPLDICPLVLMQVGYNSGMRPPVEPGSPAVVIGDGLVGHWTAQTLAWRGADVMLVGRHDDRLAKLAEFPGGRTVNARKEDWMEAVRSAFGSGTLIGVDTVGSIEIMNQLGSLLGRFGHIVSAGFYGPDDRLPLQPPRYGEHTIHLVSGWTRDRMNATIEAIVDGGLKARHLLTHRFPVDAAADAWQLIENKSEPVLGVVLEWN